MRDKIVFFVLGAILATIAYLIGDLETLTAEDEFLELGNLRVDRLHVKDVIIVGDRGEKFIMIMANNEYAQIDLHGGGYSDDFLKVGDKPVLSLISHDTGALVRAQSQYKRAEAVSMLGVGNMNGKKYFSLLSIEDLDGKNALTTD